MALDVRIEDSLVLLTLNLVLSSSWLLGFGVNYRCDRNIANNGEKIHTGKQLWNPPLFSNINRNQPT